METKETNAELLVVRRLKESGQVKDTEDLKKWFESIYKKDSKFEAVKIHVPEMNYLIQSDTWTPIGEVKVKTYWIRLKPLIEAWEAEEKPSLVTIEEIVERIKLNYGIKGRTEFNIWLKSRILNKEGLIELYTFEGSESINECGYSISGNKSTLHKIDAETLAGTFDMIELRKTTRNGKED